MADVGIGAGESRLRAHGNIAGEENAVRLDPNRGVAPRVVRTHGDELHFHTAEIERVIPIEGHVRLAEIDILEQFGIDRRATREHLRKLQAKIRNVLRLVVWTDQRAALKKDLRDTMA